MSDEFYIGYEPDMPPAFARVVRRIVVILLVLAAAVPALLLYAQGRFESGVFEYGTIRHVSGHIVERPYPMLDTGAGLVLLVAPFKFGAAGLVDGLDGHQVRLAGTLIERDGLRMIEVEPGSIDSLGRRDGQLRMIEHGVATVHGEIVDPKCYLGVMKPATKQVHRDCAVRCLSGGIPPMLVSDGPDGTPQRYLLLSSSGARLRRSLETLVARPLSVSGRVMTTGGLRFLAVDGIEVRQTSD